MTRRYFAHGELPLVLLALVGQRPRHGYELMTELRRLFAPHYRPSPGTIYPALDALASEGLLSGRSEHGRTVWRLTRPGRDAVDARAPALAALELRTGVRLGDEASFDHELARFTARLAPLANRIDPHTVGIVLDGAATRLEALALSRSTDRRTR